MVSLIWHPHSDRETQAYPILDPIVAAPIDYNDTARIGRIAALILNEIRPRDA
jgi:hypothetical protein